MGNCGGPGLHGDRGCGLYLLFLLLWSFEGRVGSPHRAHSQHLPPATVPSPAKFLPLTKLQRSAPRSLPPQGSTCLQFTGHFLCQDPRCEDTPPQLGLSKASTSAPPGRSSRPDYHFTGRSRKDCFEFNEANYEKVYSDCPR